MHWGHHNLTQPRLSVIHVPDICFSCYNPRVVASCELEVSIMPLLLMGKDRDLFQYPVRRCIIRSHTVSKPWCSLAYCIVLKLNMLLNNSAAGATVKFQSHRVIFYTNLAASRLCEISWNGVLSDIETGPWLLWSGGGEEWNGCTLDGTAGTYVSTVVNDVPTSLLIRVGHWTRCMFATMTMYTAEHLIMCAFVVFLYHSLGAPSEAGDCSHPLPMAHRDC